MKRVKTILFALVFILVIPGCVSPSQQTEAYPSFEISSTAYPESKPLPYPVTVSPTYPDPIPIPTKTPLSGTEGAIYTLLAHYGWTINHIISSQIETLPERFVYEPGAFPYVLYWAYNNEFSKQIDLDISPYLGKRVEAYYFSLNEPLPEIFRPYTEARAVVITLNGAIVGAGIEKVAGYACSLDRKLFDEIVEQDWSGWLVASGVVDPDNEMDRELSSKTPEEIIEIYYVALNAKDYRQLSAVRSRRNQIGDLYINKEDSALFNHQDESSMFKAMNNIESAILLKVTPKGKHCLPLYEAQVGFQFLNPRKWTIPEGTNLRFVVLVEEIKGLGLRVEEINTAPGVSQQKCHPRTDY